MDNQQVSQPLAPTQPVAEQSSLSSPNKKKIPKWVIVVGVVATVVIISIIIFFVGISMLVNITTSNAVKVGNQFVSDIQSENSNAAFSLTSSSFRQADNETQLSQIINSVSPALQGTTKIIAKTINATSGTKNIAIIVYSIQTNAGKKYIRVLLQYNKTWQVLNFRSSNTPLSDTSVN